MHPAQARRVGAIDVVRGFLMVVIIAAHTLVNLEPGHERLRMVARYLLSGTVGFTTVSGLLVGWFALLKRDRYDRVVRRYLIQAVRLLVIAHPLMSLALFLPNDDPLVYYALRTLFITDTLAVLFLTVVPLVPRVAPRVRLAIGLAMIVGNALLPLWVPESKPARLLFELLHGVDPTRPHILVSDYATLPLGGMFLVGTYVGARLANAQQRGAEERFASQAGRGAAVLAVCGVLLVGLWRVAHVVGLGELARLLYPDFETTLYPLYLGWTLLALSRAIGWRPDHALVQILSLLGRTSLFVYVVHYYVVETIPQLLGWNHGLTSAQLAALWIVSMGLLIALAAAWSRWVKRV